MGTKRAAFTAHSRPGRPLPHPRERMDAGVVGHTAGLPVQTSLTALRCVPVLPVHVKGPQHCRPQHTELSLLGGPQCIATAGGHSGELAGHCQFSSCEEPVLTHSPGSHDQAVYKGSSTR